MAEELTRSLTKLAERGNPRGAADVLFEARRDASRREAPRYRRRPGWAVAAAFAMTIVMVGGALGLGLALREPGSDVGAAWIVDVIGDSATVVSTGWLIIPAIVGSVAIALIVRNKTHARKELAMATITEPTPTKELETTKRNNHWLIIAVVVLAAALLGLGAWVIYDLSTESDIAATSGIDAVYDDYLAAYANGDPDAFVAATTAAYMFRSFGETRTQSEQAATISGLSTLEIQRVGDLVVMGDGPVYYVAVAERVTVADAEYVGVSAYRMIETEDGLKISEHDWVGNL